MDTAAEKESFLALIRDNQRIIFKICNTYCIHKSEREDLAQEIMYQLWKSGRQYNTEYTFSTWMYRVALNVAISFYRRKLTSPVIAFRENYPEVPDSQDSAEESAEDIIHLQKFIRNLKELDRAVMLLYLEEKTYKEIAEIVGISETNTATKISRIKTMLKQNFIDLKN
jgi:RNA polymerase sigma factor (sigma-70 family)